MSYISFGNEQVQLHFDKNQGYLEQIQYKEKVIQLHSKLWSIQTGETKLEIEDMESFRFEIYTGTLRLFWKSNIAEVVVTVHSGKNGEIRWNIRTNLFCEKTIRKIYFPIIEGLSFEEENYLLITWQNGHLLKNPIDTLLSKEKEISFWMGRGKKAYENEYPAGLSFQYAAFYSLASHGFYFATEDADAYIKTFTYQYNEQYHALDFIITNYPENMGSTCSYCMPYDFVMRMFCGDWQTATQLYRQWAIKQKWCKDRLVDKELPEKLIKTDLWRINHMNYALGTRTQEYLDTSKFLQDTLNCNLALHWYGWNMGQHDVNYPDYISAQKKTEGWPTQLKAWNEKFDEEGIVKIPYINARLWEKNTESWMTENALISAIKNESGELPDEPWHDYTQLKPICPSTAKWQNKVAEMCKEYVLDCGFDGVYLDQIASFNATLCFDPTHPHPIGGGTWWNDSYHSMLRNVRDLLGKDKIITSESCCETYVDVFDLFLILDTNFQHGGFNAVTGSGDSQSVPLFSMIYGDYALSYGSMCRFCDRLDQFEYNFIRNILWGILPTIEGAEQSELNASSAKDVLGVIKRGVDFYKANKDILLFGRLCEIPTYECENLQLDWEIAGEGSYIDTFSAISAVIWETAEREKVMFAYNYHEQSHVMRWNGQEYEVAGKSFLTVCCNNQNGRELV